MRIEPGHENLRAGDAELLQRCIGDADDVLDALARDQRQRLAHAHVQGRVHDALVVEADHQEHVVDRRAASRSRRTRGSRRRKCPPPRSSARSAAPPLRLRPRAPAPPEWRGARRRARRGRRRHLPCRTPPAHWLPSRPSSRFTAPFDQSASAALATTLSRGESPAALACISTAAGSPTSSGRATPPVTRASSAALSAISGPIPAGSPVAMAMRGNGMTVGFLSGGNAAYNPAYNKS